MSQYRSPNRDRLIRTVRRLEPLLDELVFVGGQMVELLVTDRAAVRPRVTDDVDVVVGVSTRTAYAKIQEQLRTLGFQPDMRQRAPLCRLRTAEDLVLDVMPLDEEILGFSNRWYASALETARGVELEPGLTIRAIDAPTFLATKWEAYDARGMSNPIMSRDVQDIIAVVAGRSSVVEEIRAAPPNVRRFVGEATRRFLADSSADEAVLDALPEAARFPAQVGEVVARLREIAAG